MTFLQVVDIMRVNVDKVLERDQKISELDDRAGEWHGSLHAELVLNCVKFKQQCRNKKVLSRIALVAMCQTKNHFGCMRKYV